MTRPRLKQLPMFVDPRLRAEVEQLAAREREIALALHRLVVSHGRTWLDVVAEASRDMHRDLIDTQLTLAPVALAELLGRTTRRRAVRARHRAWHEIHATGRTHEEIATAFGVHHTTVRLGVATHEARLASDRAAQDAVLAYQREHDAATGAGTA